MKGQKKIALIFATGTILTTRSTRTIFFVESESDQPKWLEEMPELNLIADIKPYFFKPESQALSIDDVIKLAGLVDSLRDEVDGLVILMRADNLPLLSTLFNFLLQNFGKPIIFTGSAFSPAALEQGKLSDLAKKFSSLGLKSNVINAVQVATRDLPKIAIMYGNRLIEPYKAVKTSLDSINLFTSIDDKYLGKVEFSIKLDHNKDSKLPAYQMFGQLNTNINVFYSTLLTTDKIKKSHADVLIVHINENETLDFKLQQALKESGKLVVLYNPWYVLDHPGFICLSKQTKDAVLAKVMWLSAFVKAKEQFADKMLSNVIGELAQ